MINACCEMVPCLRSVWISVAVNAAENKLYIVMVVQSWNTSITFSIKKKTNKKRTSVTCSQKSSLGSFCTLLWCLFGYATLSTLVVIGILFSNISICRGGFILSAFSAGFGIWMMNFTVTCLLFQLEPINAKFSSQFSQATTACLCEICWYQWPYP